MNPEERFEVIGLIEDLKTILGKQASLIPLSLHDTERYKTLRQKLLADPRVGSILPRVVVECHTTLDAYGYVHAQGGNFPWQKVEWLRQQFDPILKVLQRDSSPGQQQFFPANTQHDAYVAIRDIVRRAKNEVLIVDNYVDANIWVLLKNVPAGARVRILTKSIPPDFSLEAKKFEAQHNPVEVRTSTSMHDRFVAIDKAECWHLGHSIKDFGTKGSMVSQIVSEELIKSIIGTIETEWSEAKSLL